MRIALPLALLLSGCSGAVLERGEVDQEFTKREAEGAPKDELCKLAKKGLKLSEPKNEKAASDNGQYFWYLRVDANCPKVAP